MITIGKPYLEQEGEKVYLKSHIKDDAQRIETEIWYSSDSKWGGGIFLMM